MLTLLRGPNGECKIQTQCGNGCGGYMGGGGGGGGGESYIPLNKNITVSDHYIGNN